jgi:hypothetical protein
MRRADTRIDREETLGEYKIVGIRDVPIGCVEGGAPCLTTYFHKSLV